MGFDREQGIELGRTYATKTICVLKKNAETINYVGASIVRF